MPNPRFFPLRQHADTSYASAIRAKGLAVASSLALLGAVADAQDYHRHKDLDGAVIYDYDPATRMGDAVFGTVIADFANRAKGSPRCSHGGPVCMEYADGSLVAFYANTSSHNVDGWSEYATRKRRLPSGSRIAKLAVHPKQASLPTAASKAARWAVFVSPIGESSWVSPVVARRRRRGSAKPLFSAGRLSSEGTSSMGDVARLQVDNQEIEFPIRVGTEKERAIDISRLRAETGLITLDEGFVNTGSTTSAITYLDGENGILRYRGYPIEQIAANCDFIETSYLLIYGELPTSEQLEQFRMSLRRHSMLHEEMRSFYDGFPRDAHPMAILSSVVGALSTFYQDSLDPRDPEQVEISVRRLMAKLPTIAAYAHKKSIGQPFLYPRNDLAYCENFLRMMFGVPSEPYQINPQFADALNLLLIVHADHEQNCSTSTVRMVGSSDANLFASVAAGICALWGPLHGGANEACVNMLEQILEDGGNVKKYVDMAKDKNSDYRLMGFGHRVYKNHDPRARLIKEACDNLLANLDRRDPIFEIAQELAEVALSDEYFIERKLYPNVDFYSGVIYRAIGIPIQMFTVLFAMGRLPGWISHWIEMHQSPTKRISRPRQIYTGPSKRDFVPIDQRG